jgi:hypothetical protein
LKQLCHNFLSQEKFADSLEVAPKYSDSHRLQHIRASASFCSMDKVTVVTEQLVWRTAWIAKLLHPVPIPRKFSVAFIFAPDIIFLVLWS